VKDDGGRAASGRRGTTGDCSCRAIAIATGRPYAEVYSMLNDFAKRERFQRGRIGRAAATGRGSHARTGVIRKTLRDFMASLGWEWTATMRIGSGCMTHLRPGELPPGRLVVAVSGHTVAVIDGVVHDNYDPSRGGTRCVYGYWRRK
jgi:hypothetical protein